MVRSPGDRFMRTIVLTGMPGSGRSTGRVRVAKTPGRKFIDTDIRIRRPAAGSVRSCKSLGTTPQVPYAGHTKRNIHEETNDTFPVIPHVLRRMWNTKCGYEKLLFELWQNPAQEPALPGVCSISHATTAGHGNGHDGSAGEGYCCRISGSHLPARIPKTRGLSTPTGSAGSCKTSAE